MKYVLRIIREKFIYYKDIAIANKFCKPGTKKQIKSFFWRHRMPFQLLRLQILNLAL